ncbi:MAG: 3-phosphoglycerate dehydrogenase [Bacillales bacterium]|jgi:D-3-phosphoglycerate dehydrogenase|nr:3-phosphoglycerate dehydrogenase [Bacillales bacterium]
MYKIATMNNISNLGLEIFNRNNYQIENSLIDADAIMVRSSKINIDDIPETVKAISRAGAGTNNIPVSECTDKGIVVFNTPGANANAVKEMVITSLLLSSRNVIDAVNWVKSIKDVDNLNELIEANKKTFKGCEIAGKKLGIVGLGAIGALVANDALALDMDVMGFDPFISVDTAWRLSKNLQRAYSLEEIFSSCDYITIHVPLTNETKGFIDSELLSKLKHGAKLLNFSRGELVNEGALREALVTEQLGFYVTDFPNKNVLTMPNVIAIPHLGASTGESEDNCAVMAAKQLVVYLETGNIRNSVNFPNAELPFIEKNRITIMHKNIPNMVGQIAGILAENSVNIADMLNKSKGNWAYTMIDMDEDIGKEVEERLQNISGVINVRKIRGV